MRTANVIESLPAVTTGWYSPAAVGVVTDEAVVKSTQ